MIRSQGAIRESFPVLLVVALAIGSVAAAAIVPSRAYAEAASVNIGIIGGTTLPAQGDARCSENPWTDATNIMTGNLFDGIDPITCLPTTASNFTGFTFSPVSLPITDLSGYDTLVLNVASPALFNGDVLSPECNINNLSGDDKSAIVSFLLGGGKLIIYDSECAAVDYTWLPQNLQFTTFNPGRSGAFGNGTIIENNSLSTDIPKDEFEIFMGATNVVDDGLCNTTDACGDANVMITLSSELCKDIDVTAIPEVGDVKVTGTVHAYSKESSAGSGLLIYNGFDLDDATANTIPRANETGALAKLFLLELKQPWNPSGLPCSVPIGAEEPTPAHLVVIKHVINDNGGTAAASDYTISVSGNSPSLTSFAGSEEGVTIDIRTGLYSVSETGGPSGYLSTLSDDCSGSITDGETKTCTITNDDIQPLITVTKTVVNDNGGTAEVADFVLTVGSTSVTSGVQTGIDAGTYTVSETGPSGYSSSLTGDCDAEGSITLVVGGVYDCSVTNDDRPARITIEKIVINDDGGSQTNFDAFIRLDGVVVGTGTFDHNATSFAVTEDAIEGYTTTFDGSCSGTVNIDEAVTCTITNDDNSQPPANNPPSVDAGPDTEVNEGAILILDGTASDPDAGDTLTFVWTQLDGGPSVTLSEADTLTPSFTAPSVTEDATITLRLTATDNHGASSSDDITITIKNVPPPPEPAHLIVVKHVINDNGGVAVAANFTISVTGEAATPNSFTGDEAGTEVELAAGTYSVSETGGPSGYSSALSADCSGSIAEGETKTCTITNDDRPARITIEKIVINDDGGSQTDFNAFIRLDGVLTGTGTFEHNAGSFVVTEDAVEGYEATFGDNCSGSIAIGESVICTITNNDIAVQPPANTPGKITAGGAQIGKNVNFGFVVQSTDGENIKGQLEYQDKSLGINLHSVEMTSLQISEDGIHGTFSGTATVNGKAGYSFTITVDDNGEPGRQDTFRIVIPELNYDEDGTLAKGNIQIHKS